MSESTVTDSTGSAVSEPATQERTESSPLDTARSFVEEQAQKFFQEKASLEAQLAEARSDAEKAKKGLSTYQQNTTQKLQRLAQLEREQAYVDDLKSEIADLKLVIKRIADSTLEPTTAQELELERKTAELNRAQARATRTANEVQSQGQYMTDEAMNAYKARLLAENAPETVIKPDDPRIDWAGDAPDFASWKARFLDSVRRAEISDLRNGQQAPQASATNDLTAAIKASTEDALSQLREEFDRRVAALTKTEQKAEQATEEARIEAEKKLRAAGVDATEVTARPGAEIAGVQQIEEQLDESLLATPEGRKVYAERQRQIRARLFGTAH